MRARVIGRASARAIALLETVRRPPTLWERVTHARGPVEAWVALERQLEPVMLRDLLAIAVSDDRGAARVARLIAGLVARLDPRELLVLDEWLRRAMPLAGPYRDAWVELTPRRLAQLPADDEPARVVLALCALHGNGHVRERAVIRLGQLRDGTELPFLLLRVNDWVAPVRLRARTAVLERLEPAYASAFVRSVPLLRYLARARRSDHADLLQAVTELLAGASGRAALRNGLSARDRETRRWCYELAGAAPGGWPDWLIRQGIRDEDVVVRRMAYARAVAQAGGRLPPELVPAAAADSVAAIRRFALHSLAGRGERGPALGDFLLDLSPSIRGEAQHAYDGGRDAARAFYRDAVRRLHGVGLAAAVAGLGEVGDATDASRIEALAQSPSARVRRSALRSLARLTGAAAVPRLVQALLTDAPSVVAEARRLLGPHVGQLDAVELWQAAGARDAADALVQLLLLFKRRSKWERLAFVLDACSRTDARLGTLGLRELRLWLVQSNRSFTVLPPALRSELVDRLARTQQYLPVALAAEVGFAIRNG